MIPFARIVKYGNTSYDNPNKIISVLQNQMHDFVVKSSNINVTPTNFVTSQNNAIQFPASGYLQIGSGGVPSVFSIGNSTNFVIESNVYLTSTATQILVGNLNNNLGTGSYWVTLNNVFGAASQISLDGYSTTGSVQRFRFGVGSTKLPINTWFKIKLQRVGTNLSFWLNDVQIGTSQVMSLGFSSSSNTLRIGNSTDNAIPLIGIIDNYRMTMSV